MRTPLLAILFVMLTLLGVGVLHAEETFTWHDASLIPVEGQGWKHLPGPFARLPVDAEKTVRKQIWHLGKQSAGLVVRFQTDAANIRVRHRLGWAPNMPHMTATGSSGLDLYAKQEGRWFWAGATKPKTKEYEETILKGVSGEPRTYQLYLPLYNVTEALVIGVPAGASFEALDVSPLKPIVYYGSSIAQGCSASRPGLVFTSILGRRLDHPMINLGFSGNAIMEPEIAELLTQIDAAVYVIDAAPNMIPERIRSHAENFLRHLRRARPETPILLIEARKHPDARFIPEKAALFQAKSEELRKVHDKLQAEKISKLFYLEGATLFGTDEEGTVDGSHPNDLGMVRMADAVEPLLRQILTKQ